MSHSPASPIAAGDLRRAADVEGWITAVLRHGSGRSDAILLAHARRPAKPRKRLSAALPCRLNVK